MTVRRSLLHAGPADGLREESCQAVPWFEFFSFLTWCWSGHRDVYYNRVTSRVGYYVLCPDLKNEFVAKWYKHPDTSSQSATGLGRHRNTVIITIRTKVPEVLNEAPNTNSSHCATLSKCSKFGPCSNLELPMVQVPGRTVARQPIRAALISGNGLVVKFGHVTSISAVVTRQSPRYIVIGTLSSLQSSSASAEGLDRSRFRLPFSLPLRFRPALSFCSQPSTVYTTLVQSTALFRFLVNSVSPLT